MAKHVITANRLRDGLIVFLTVSGESHAWSTDFAAAAALENGQLDHWLEAAKADQAACQVIDPYSVELDASGLPNTQRERIRAAGPSIPFGHDALGK